MRTNRLSMWFVAVISLLITACSEQETINSVNSLGGETLHATISEDKAATRSIVIDNPGVKLETFWDTGDIIGVSGSASQNVKFTIAEGTISANGKSADFKTNSDTPTGDLVAYYPYNEKAVVADNDITLDFPATQKYTRINGVPQPDPKACVMAGKGSASTGIEFMNVMAVLKVGQVFTSETTVSSIEFRDLSDASVCGTYKINLAGSVPSSEFTGSGKVITLDMGASGIKAEANTLFTAFVVVPARNYPKGFEVTFVAADGKRTIKTAGSKQGKKLERSVVYPIGDITTYEDIPGMICELKPTAQIMTPEKLDMVTIIDNANNYVVTEDGSLAMDANGNYIRMPELTMLVDKDMNPQVDGYLIFNQPSNEMPQGGIYKVKTCTLAADGEHYEVYAVPETNIAAPFEKLIIGEPLYDENGNLNENGGIELDISSYVKEIRDGEGNVINTRSVPTYDTNASEAMTRATIHKQFKAPALTLSIDEKEHCACDISAQMSVSMRIAIGIIHGELQYVYQTVNPTLDLKTTFALYAKIEKEKRERLMNFLFGGIPVGPLVFMPEIGFDGFVGIGGEAKLSASKTFSYDLGTYGLAYNKGDGFQYRRLPTPAPEPATDFEPQLEAGLSASIYAFGGIAMRVGVSISGMFSFGANTDAKLTFGIANETNSSGAILATKVHLTPGLEIAPYGAVLNGKISTVWRDVQGKIEFDPLWERYLSPIVESATVFRIAKLSEKKYMFDTDEGEDKLACQVYTDVTEATYRVEVKKPIFKHLTLAVQVLQGDDIEYYNFENLARFEAMKADGAAHIAYMLDECEGRLVGDVHESYHSPIDTYPSDTDGKVLEGKCKISTHSGKPFSLRLVWVDFAGRETPITNWNKPFIYYWPNDANGVPYNEYTGGF